jgi:hypothetical protein
MGTLLTVPVFGAGVHGGAATVAEVPGARDVLPGVPVLLVPVSGVVLDGMFDELEADVVCEVEVVEGVEVPVAVLLEGVHGATVFVVPD